MPTKKKQLTEKQASQLMTRRRSCIQKYRKSYKNKSISFSNPVVSSVKEIPKETKKRVYKKKAAAVEQEPVLEEPVVEEPVEEPVKKKRVYKKKVKEPVLEEEPVIEEEPVLEEKPVKKKRTYTRKPKETI